MLDLTQLNDVAFIFRPGKQNKPQNREEVREWFENSQAHNISQRHLFPPWLHGKTQQLLLNYKNTISL